jgi:hypothetical protein
MHDMNDDLVPVPAGSIAEQSLATARAAAADFAAASKAAFCFRSLSRWAPPEANAGERGCIGDQKACGNCSA